VLEEQAAVGDRAAHPAFVQQPLLIPGPGVRDRLSAEPGPHEDQLGIPVSFHLTSLIDPVAGGSGRTGALIWPGGGNDSAAAVVTDLRR
jgi:hypothetical protein